MNPEAWAKLEELFQQAVERPPEERPAFVATAAAEHPELQTHLEMLLEADTNTTQFLEKPVLPGQAASMPLGSPSDVAPRDHIGPYKLLRKLGEGGMSQVHLAVRDDEFQKLVALKIIRRGMDTEDLQLRFRRERQILASLDHPNIAKLLDGGTTEDGLPYFVMDHIEGVPIDEYCDRRRLSVKERLQLFLEVCSAVRYAHQNLVVHRDLKAHNILVAQDGTPRLLDFGIAKLLKPEQFPVPVELTAASVRPMTPFYASPEQVQGKLITTTSDVYSLGVLLYRLLTGHFPYRFDTGTQRDIERVVLEQDPESATTAILREETVPGRDGEKDTTITPEIVCKARRTQPHQLRRELAGDLDAILMKALRKEPQLRYESVEQLSEDLRRHLEGQPVLAHQGSLRYRVGKFLRRNRVAVGIAAAFVTLLLGFAATMALQARRIAHERDQAQHERDRAEQVVTFLQDIFRLSDPLEEGGESITAREILDRGAERVEKELAGQPIVQATLKEAIGNVYNNLGLYEKAEPLLREALETRGQAMGEENLAVAQNLNNLGIVLVEKGEYVAAKPLFERALDLRTRLLGEEHSDVAQSLHNLGRLYQQTGDFRRSKELYERAIDVQRRTDPEGPNLGAQVADLANLLRQMGELDGAEDLYRQALELRRQRFGPRHPRVGQSLNDLGVILGVRGDYKAADPLFREALAIRRETLGDRHPSVAQTLNNLGRLHAEKGEHEEAEALLLESLAIDSERLGPEHPQTALRLHNLGGVQRAMGKLQEAEASHREALRIRREVFGSEHSQVGMSTAALGFVLNEMGRAEEAELLLRESLQVLVATLSEDHWRVAEARAHLGDSLAAQGRFAEAEPWLIEGYESLRDKRGGENRRTKHALSRLIALYTAWGKVEQEAHYRSIAAARTST